MPSEVRKLKDLEEENGRLRRLVSDLSLDKEMLQEVLKKSLRPAQEPELVDHLRTCFPVGTRRACRVLILHRSMYLYRSRRPAQAVLRKRIREIAETRGPIRKSADPHPVATRGLVSRPNPGVPALWARRPANASQAAPAQGHGQGSRRSDDSNCTQ
jgi:hypothetical protein